MLFIFSDEKVEIKFKTKVFLKKSRFNYINYKFFFFK